MDDGPQTTDHGLLTIHGVVICAHESQMRPEDRRACAAWLRGQAARLKGLPDCEAIRAQIARLEETARGLEHYA